ncbi:Phage repressor protein C, contains Cro/C1-type HTH and peptisase s24 domains [Moraxella cuniculi DSM 21768]|uniref:Phage repressor protein C, contains Cro/C1-type HTH and peptisase s24 domains n=1 Tax=Moraxella cuniculi DSM 21768 TaxID=1122245 RepID=A0A1N7DPA7_9GAMM|nr:helix-turn-helix transcriptional regulator [Moraxella cuniculi]OOS05974.1 hypothetical protein B0189_05780 [Moraxella cuniculi]SIR77713.1 Phage repressor protein C, contains Cro/C1-type HTH and peptisase s24 domains [Moraxella cuniculi DSM 21768]
MELKDRLKQARKQAGLTQADTAKRIGMAQGTYSALERGESKSTAKIVQIAELFGVNPQWLATGEGEQLTARARVDEIIARLPNGITHEEIEEWRDQAWVSFYDVRFCCGDGAGYAEFEPLKKTLPFDNTFFHYRRINPKNFKMIYAVGDSMAPYINHGDAVGIDITDIEPREGEVYALFLDGDTMIKRIFKEGGGVLRLTSDNPQYKDKIIDESNGESLIIIGRVRYRSG